MSALAMELDRLDASCTNAANAAIAEFDYEVNRLSMRLADQAEARGRALAERMADTLDQIGALPRPSGRAGAASLEADEWPPASPYGPGLLRIGTVPLDGRFSVPVAYVPPHRNVEIVARRPEDDQRATDIMRTLLLRRVLDTAPGMQRVVVIDRGRVTGPLLEFAELASATRPLITFAVDTEQALTVLGGLSTEMQHTHVAVLRGERSSEAHNLRVEASDRLPFTTVVLPNGTSELDARVVDLIGILALEGPDAGVTVLARWPSRQSGTPLHRSIEVQIGSNVQLVDEDITFVLDIDLDRPPSEGTVRTLVRNVASASRRPLAAPAANAPTTGTAADGWATYVRLLRSAQHDLRREADLLDDDGRAQREEHATLQALKDHRMAVVTSHGARIRRAGRMKEEIERELAFHPPAGAKVGRTDLSKGVDGLLTAIERDVDEVADLMAAAVRARDDARAEAFEREERDRATRHAQAWEQADRRKAHDRRQVVPAISTVVAALVPWVLWASHHAAFWGAVFLTIGLSALTFAMLHLDDATRAIVHHLGRWPTAYHPDDGPDLDDTKTAVVGVRPWLAAALVSTSAAVGAIAGAVATGPTLSRTVVVMALGGATAYLWAQAGPFLDALSGRARRFTARRPHRNAT